MVKFVKQFQVLEGHGLGAIIDVGMAAAIIEPYRNRLNVIVSQRYWMMTLAGPAAVRESYMKAT
jgi:3-deoxy-D-manno-octulosonate 8-phosphate phosphatase KdsC-like HAD superfamily phosphatase